MNVGQLITESMQGQRDRDEMRVHMWYVADECLRSWKRMQQKLVDAGWISLDSDGKVV